MENRLRLVASLVLLALVCAAVTATEDHPMKGQPAPAFDLASLDGDRVSSADYRGQFIVLHFGAGW